MGWVVNATPRPLYPRGKTRYPLYRRLGGPQGRLSGRVQKISPPPGFDPLTVRWLASTFQDCTQIPYELDDLQIWVQLTAGRTDLTLSTVF